MEDPGIDEAKYFERNMAAFGSYSSNRVRNLSIIIVDLNHVVPALPRWGWRAQSASSLLDPSEFRSLTRTSSMSVRGTPTGPSETNTSTRFVPKRIWETSKR